MFGIKKSPISFLPADVVDALRSNFRRDEIDVLAGLGTMIELPAGAELATEESVGREAMVLVKGTASVIRAGMTVATLTAGDMLGEISLLSGARRNATIVADSAVSVYVLSASEFRTLMSLCPRLATRTAVTAIRRLAETDGSAESPR